MLRGAAYYPEHRDPARWEYDLDMMAGAHLNCVRVGEFAWKRFEPHEGQFDFAWLERFSGLAAERGIGLLLCPPLRTAPAWLVAKDPAVKLEREDSVRLEFGTRYSFCINHPLLRERGRAVAEALSSRFGSDPNVVGWHLDNEHGDEPDCHCPVCTEMFRAWCAERYGTIEDLNDRWGLVFWGLELNSFDHVPTPRISKTFHGPGHLLAWRRFRSQCTVDAVAMQAEAVRLHARPAQFVTTNNQLWNNRTDYYAMARHLDVAGTNFYPAFGDGQMFNAWALAMCRSYRRQGFQVHELRNGPHMIPGEGGNQPAPGEVERLVMHCVANGADATFFFRWRACPFGCEQSHGTLTDYDGRPKRVYAEAERTYAKLARLDDVLAGTGVESDVGVLLDFPTRWVMETGVRWNGPPGLYTAHCRKLFEAVRANGMNCDAVGRDADFADYTVLVVPALATIDDGLAAQFRAFVEEGGTLVWHPLSGIKDEEATIYPDRLHPDMKRLLSVDVTEFATAGSGEPITFTWNGREYEGRDFCDLPVLEGAECRGEFTSSWYGGTPAVTEARSGEGRAIYVMTFASDEFYRDLFAALLAEADIGPILDTNVPAGVEIAERCGAGGGLVFLLNANAAETTIELPGPMRDVYNDEDVSACVALPPFGVRVLAEPST